MKTFKQFIAENIFNSFEIEYDPFSKDEIQYRFGGWITENQILFESSSPDWMSDEGKQKYMEVLKPRLKKVFDTYGPADSEAPSTSTLKQRVSDRFDTMAHLRDHDPKEYKKQVAAAKARRSAAGIGSAIASNEKTDTVTDIPHPHGPNGHIPISMAFTPDIARHYTSSDGTHAIERNVCSGSSESCRTACLAKHGNYGFSSTQAHMAIRTQGLTHNKQATEDHATLAFHEIHTAAQKAKKEKKAVLVRTAVSDDTGPEIHDEAISRHFPASGNDRYGPTEQMRYTKKVNTRHAPEKGIHTIFSDPGPMTLHDAKGNVTGLARENIQRRSLEKKVPEKPKYMVFNGRRERDPRYKSTLEKLKVVRKYEPLPSTPKQGEAEEYHHPEGHGRVVHNGKSYRYQDYPVAQKIKTVSSKKIFPAEHDARNSDTTDVTFKTPEGKKVGHVVLAFATKSTSSKDLNGSGFFHHIESIDKHGVYHDGHPAEMEAAGFKPHIGKV